jgi:hypothetical protein
MSRDEFVQDCLRQADEAELWSRLTTEPLLRARWQKLAKEYRELAQSRSELLPPGTLREQQSQMQNAKASGQD